MAYSASPLDAWSNSSSGVSRGNSLTLPPRTFCMQVGCAVCLHNKQSTNLVLHEQLGMATLLVALVLEVLGKARQAHVVAIKVGIHRMVHV